MLRNLFTLLLVVVLFSALMNAQEKTYMRPDGKFYKSNQTPSSYEVMKMKHVRPETGTFKSPTVNKPAGTNGLIDTLSYPMPSPGVNFGALGQDAVLQWFKAPADLTIKAFAFYCTDAAAVANGGIFEGKIVKVNSTEADLLALGDKYHGYYEATANGYHDATSFLDNADRTGAWVPITGGLLEPFGADIWSDAGFGAPITPDETLNDYQWLQTNILFEPTVLGGEIFGIVYKNTYTTLDALDAHRLGVFGGAGVGYPAFKYYADPRTPGGTDFGWWSRAYTWDFLVEVDITGNTPPDINSFTTGFTGTIDLGPYTVNANITDANAGNPANAGVASANLYWSIDGGTTWSAAVPMTGTEPNFSADIPAQVAGTTVEYYLDATDKDGQTMVSSTKSFYVFAPSGVKTLVVLNGYDSGTGYPQDYLFGEEIQTAVSSFDHDTWFYGALPTTGLLDNYDNVFEICNGAPADYNDDAIKPWLAGSGTRNYYLEGQEWLGLRYGYADKTFAAGSFEFDVLGINQSYNDVSYVTATSSGHLIPSKLMPQTGTAFGQPQLDLFATYTPAPDSIQYNPAYEGNTGDQNWIDGYNVEADVVADVMTETRGIAGVADVRNLNCASHRTLTGGNKIFYASYWTYAVDTYRNYLNPKYNWLGVANESSAYQALLWFGIPILTDVEQVGNNIPKEFSISQNYPNPFNPSTTINFSLPKASNVVIKVFDVLGREVATLLNGEKAAGNYEVNFDASKLSSGLYVYTINAGSFTSTKKMMLMK